MRIYADNAATTKVSPKALEAMLPYFQIEYGNPSSFYREGQQAKSAIEDARIKIALRGDYEKVKLIIFKIFVGKSVQKLFFERIGGDLLRDGPQDRRPDADHPLRRHRRYQRGLKALVFFISV